MDDLKDSFLFYRSFAETVRMIPDEAQQLTLLNALIDYGLSGVEPELPYPLNLPLHQMIASIDGAKRRRVAQSKNGKKGGAPRGNKNANKKTTQTSENNLNVNGNGNVNDNYHLLLHDTTTDFDIVGQPDGARLNAAPPSAPESKLYAVKAWVDENGKIITEKR